MARYKCGSCKMVVNRVSKKAWVKSYCEKTGKTVHLTRVKRAKL